MSMSPARIDSEKLRAFEQRMSSEGAAGFADGPAPWEDWDDALPIRGRRAQKDDVPQLHRRKPHKPRKPVGQRILSGITRLSVLALVIGIAGVYFTSDTPPQLAGNGTQPEPAKATQTPDNTPPLAVLEPWQNSVIIDPNLLPAPAAGTPDIAVVAVTKDTPEIPQAAPASTDIENSAPADTAVPEVVENETPEVIDPTPMQATGQPGTAESVAAQQQPAAMASPEIVPEVIQKTETPLAPAAQTSSGRWVVNLASYNRESTAQRMLDEFRDKGVTAELVKVTVNDKPMIRIRTTGHESYREARDWAALLEERLELDGAWISKR